ncbi:hypothetical protein [Actinomadura alba]|uniref:Uncharacterized protein n=1 Tax=Actinomadura alba TaxID=406431 RepID=A0ABR7LNR5_9ACTN|nr:hypothetical protein [Actinomadura alba]MBC6466122.1 hypothetical protein [Actinomadura alba]
MALEFLGGDPESDDGGSPTVWRDPATGDYVLRGWVIADAETRTDVGADPPGEVTMRFPARMMQFFPEVNSGGADLR